MIDNNISGYEILLQDNDRFISQVATPLGIVDIFCNFNIVDNNYYLELTINGKSNIFRFKIEEQINYVITLPYFIIIKPKNSIFFNVNENAIYQ